MASLKPRPTRLQHSADPAHSSTWSRKARMSPTRPQAEAVRASKQQNADLTAKIKTTSDMTPPQPSSPSRHACSQKRTAHPLRSWAATCQASNFQSTVPLWPTTQVPNSRQRQFCSRVRTSVAVSPSDERQPASCSTLKRSNLLISVARRTNRLLTSNNVSNYLRKSPSPKQLTASNNSPLKSQ